MTNDVWNLYTSAIKSGDFVKISRLRFLQPDGSIAFSVDNDPRQKRSGAFIRSGSLSVNLQNGTRRTASIQLADVDGEFDYNVNKVWFGTEIAVDMGILTGDGTTVDGTEIWFPQGVFRVNQATQNVHPNGVTMDYSLTDKWAGIDGTLTGTLESTYTVSKGTNIFAPIVTLLGLDRGDGEPYDNMAPLFTEYYNNKTQKLQDGTTVPLTDAPYDMTVDSDDGTVADMILALCGAVNAWVGYDRSGRLRIDPSQDDILDEDKPVSWRFSLAEAQVTGLAYDYQIGDVFNDYIVLGYMTSDYVQPAARAVNEDPMSPVCVSRIGRRTKRDPQPNFATVRMCADYAEWKVKRTAILRSAVSVSCNQVFHLDENTIIEIVRTDKPGSPTERHLVQGFTLPFSGTDLMTIEAVSVHDFPTITIYTNEPATIVINGNTLTWESGTIDASGNNSPNAYSLRTVGYYTISNAVLTYTGQTTYNSTKYYYCWVFEYEANNTFIKRTQVLDYGTVTQMTLSANCAKVRFRFGHYNADGIYCGVAEGANFAMTAVTS